MKYSLVVLVFVLIQCGTEKFKHPVAIIERAEVWQDGQATPVGIVEPGDSIDFIDYTYRPADSTALVQLRNGKRGYIPVSALKVPEWHP
jgi:hypothetical protein